MRARIAIIGGSGFYEMDGIDIAERLSISTPFGDPSGEIAIAHVGTTNVAFLARHGPGHRLPPDEVPYRANIFALKTLGVQRIVAVNAVGSLHEAYEPGHLVLPSDIVDRTSGRPSSFFGPGLVAHIDFAEPFCRTVRADLLSATSLVDTEVHHGGALVVIGGPRFSTRSESRFHHAAGFKLVGMTTMPEAALAREAEICYGAVCMVTDFDVWHESADDVTAGMVIERLRKTTDHAKAFVNAAMPALISRSYCTCRDALAAAIITPPEAMDPAVVARLEPIVGRHLEG